MRIHVFETMHDAAYAGAEIIADMINSVARPVLGLATGSTPVALYRELIRRNMAGELDFSDVHTYNLDEYVGLHGSDMQSFRHFMDDKFFSHININKGNTHVPSGIGDDHEADARHYDEMIESDGGIDAQVLGIGHNGHIGFNEPDTIFHRDTHVVNLTDSTIDANKRFFKNREDVPRQAITLGMGGIMRARKIILLAFGESKADAVRAMIQGNIDPQCPASILQLHGDATLLLDKAASSKL